MKKVLRNLAMVVASLVVCFGFHLVNASTVSASSSEVNFKDLSDMLSFVEEDNGVAVMKVLNFEELQNVRFTILDRDYFNTSFGQLEFTSDNKIVLILRKTDKETADISLRNEEEVLFKNIDKYSLWVSNKDGSKKPRYSKIIPKTTPKAKPEQPPVKDPEPDISPSPQPQPVPVPTPTDTAEVVITEEGTPLGSTETPKEEVIEKVPNTTVTSELENFDVLEIEDEKTALGKVEKENEKQSDKQNKKSKKEDGKSRNGKHKGNDDSKEKHLNSYRNAGKTTKNELAKTGGLQTFFLPVFTLFFLAVSALTLTSKKRSA